MESFCHRWPYSAVTWLPGGLFFHLSFHRKYLLWLLCWFTIHLKHTHIRFVQLCLIIFVKDLLCSVLQPSAPFTQVTTFAGGPVVNGNFLLLLVCGVKGRARVFQRSLCEKKTTLPGMVDQKPGERTACLSELLRRPSCFDPKEGKCVCVCFNISYKKAESASLSIRAFLKHIFFLPCNHWLQNYPPLILLISNTQV